MWPLVHGEKKRRRIIIYEGYVYKRGWKTYGYNITEKGNREKDSVFGIYAEEGVSMSFFVWLQLGHLYACHSA